MVAIVDVIGYILFRKSNPRIRHTPPEPDMRLSVHPALPPAFSNLIKAMSILQGGIATSCLVKSEPIVLLLFIDSMTRIDNPLNGTVDFPLKGTVNTKVNTCLSY